MKIPKYIDEALKKRTKAAMRFTHYDFIISEWIEKNGLADDVDAASFHGGVESIVNPDVAEQNIRDAIKKTSSRTDLHLKLKNGEKND